MGSFVQFPSVKKLRELAKQPIDLTKPGALTPERVQAMVLSAEGFDLLYATERVTSDVLSALYLLAEEAGIEKKMRAMQEGEIVNQIEGVESERRAALHTAMRGFFGNPVEGSFAKEAIFLAEKEWKKLEAFWQKYEGKFHDLVQIGIGGSDLGPRALTIAMEAYHKPDRKIHFVSNVDPDDAAKVLKKVDLKKTLVVVVSKSGTTLETQTNEEFFRSRFVKMGIDPKEHMVAVTGEKSPMDNPRRYLASFYIWDYVGGRYSATSMVGGVTLAFALGANGFAEILKGAASMDKHARTAPLKKNLPILSALLGVWNRNFLLHPTLACIPYSQALLRFPAHLQQLDMESNGKRVDKLGKNVEFSTGPVVWGEPGTNGQHSFYQLIHQGTDPVPIEFIGFRHNQYPLDLDVNHTTSQEKLLSNLLAQSISLSIGQTNKNPNRFFPGNRPNRILFANRLDPRTMGALLAYYEHKVAFQGFLWNINSFDQEGVQLGKVLAKKILSLYAKKRGVKAEDYPLGEAYIHWTK